SFRFLQQQIPFNKQFNSNGHKYKLY
ncbi:unnamed protein product, partial [Rotaria magnacalcarata]